MSASNDSPSSPPEAQAASGEPIPATPFAPLPPLDAVAYERLAGQVKDLLGVDLGQYKPAQVWRRVHGFAAARGLADANALMDSVRADAALRQAFLDMLTINVSEFFRNPEIWDTLVKSYLRPMLDCQLGVRIWSAGCSLGFEPFSLAMLVRELKPASASHILATDLDDTTLARARKATYTEQQMAGVSEARRASFFRQVDGRWAVRPELQAMVTFRRHDLLTDPCGRPFDIITCRNVVIYFTEQAKMQLYGRFRDALRPGGILFMGATETIPNARAIGLELAGPSFYRRP
jgi:chemotaxis protein methyltransferase CheR